MESSEVARKYVFSKISELLCSQTQMTDEERMAILSKYSEGFKRSWEETFSIYKELVSKRESEDNDPASQKEEEPSGDINDNNMMDKLDEELENAIIDYEVMLLSTTKHRSKAEGLGKLLGNATRYENLAAENKRVDLPHRAPLDIPCFSSTLSYNSDAMRLRLQQCNGALSIAVTDSRYINQKLPNINEAMQYILDEN